MAEKTRTSLLAGGLILISAIVFGLGINWGLPSHDIDPTLFGAGPDSATTALNSYHLTGVGIEKLAGKWKDDANLPADVAEHPDEDRTQPLTLLENTHIPTVDELIAQGDQTLAGLAQAADAADAAYGRARLGSSDSVAEAAQEKASAAQLKLHRYLEKYDQDHFGDTSAAVAIDDTARAQILRRYRLYSFQPDEMISFRALAMMHPDDLNFDPKLYQYGGLWLYPLGAILKAGSMVGYATVTGDTTYYYDSPEVFGRFYILARAYSAAWGIVAVLAVFAIVRRVSGGSLLPFLAALCFLCMPIVMDLGHEAKPHLAGVALILLAVLAAGKYVETGKTKWFIWTAIACGASTAMVLSGAVALVILPVMSVLRLDKTPKFLSVCILGGLIAAAVYFATNPYVAIHLVGDRTVLDANLANTRAMYPAAPGVLHAAKLLAIGMSWPLAILGVVAAVLLLIRRMPSPQHLGWLLGIPAAIALIDFVIFADNKPAEYARFAIFADTALMLAAFFLVARFSPSPGTPGEGRGEGRKNCVFQAIAGLILVLIPAAYSLPYIRGFLADSTPNNTRTTAANQIDSLLPPGTATGNLYITADPAPYVLPPVNLFRWRIVLLPTGGEVPPGSPPGVLVKPLDSFSAFDPMSSPISWAAKSFDVVQTPAK